MSLCFMRELPCVVSCITTIGKHVLQRHECAEIFMDSTYKNNSSKFELFAVMTSVMGIGNPFAYMFLQQRTQIDWNHAAHGDVLVKFLRSLKINLPNLKPKFFFTDKTSGQMNAIKTGLGFSSSLCFWHMKRAVKKRIAKTVQEEHILISKENVQNLMQVLHKHYCIHLFLDGERTEQQVRV